MPAATDRSYRCARSRCPHADLRRNRHARTFAQSLVRDNLEIGRPDEVPLIFRGKIERRGRPPETPPTFKTKIVTRGVDVAVSLFYKHSRIKQYLEEGRAWRIETVINASNDIGVQRRCTSS